MNNVTLTPSKYWKRYGFMFFVILSVWFGTPDTMHAQSPDNESLPSCARCHETQGKEESDGIHVRRGVSCSGCHGGSESAADKIQAKAQGTGYLGKLSAKQIPQMCSRCHSDVSMMNPYGIQTDQYAQYLTSHHGRALVQEGKTDVATCVSCHGTHGIKTAKQDDSPIHPKNIPATCGRCHSNTDLMEKHGLRADVEKQYRQSVHAELLNQGDLSAPTCATCHGNHGAVPPGFSQVSAVCGKCHIKQKEYFDQSPHAPLVKKGEFDSCVVCHSNHKVGQATDRIFETTCRKCHEEGKPVQLRESLLAMIRSTRGEYEKTKERLKAAEQKGFLVDEELLLLKEGKTQLLQLEPVQHTLDLARVYPLSEEARKAFAGVTQRLDRRERSEQMKRLAIFPIAGFLLLMSLGFWFKHRRILAKKTTGEAPG